MKKRIKCFAVNLLFFVAMFLFFPSLSSSAAKAPSVSKKIPVYYQNSHTFYNNSWESQLVEGSNLISIKNLNGGKISNVKITNKKIEAKVFKGKYISLFVKTRPRNYIKYTLKDRDTAKLTFTVTTKNKKKYKLSTKLVFKKISTPVSSLKINGINQISKIKTVKKSNNFNVGTQPIKIDIALRKSYKIKSIELLYNEWSTIDGGGFSRLEIKNGSTIDLPALGLQNNGALTLRITYAFADAPKVRIPTSEQYKWRSNICYYLSSR